VATVYARLGAHQRMVLEDKLFEPAFSATRLSKARAHEVIRGHLEALRNLIAAHTELTNYRPTPAC
jgi:L-rhamnose isomerase